MALEVKDPGSVEPLGVGTDRVESLAGYLVRMAEAEGSHPDKLFFDSVLPELQEVLGDGIRDHHPDGLFDRALNGTGLATRTAVQRLSELSGRDVRPLSLVTLNQLGKISRNRIDREGQRWCPLCWEDDGSRPYERQSWNLAVTEVCPDHRVELSSRCHRCGRLQPKLPFCSRVGICVHCDHDLRHDPPAPIPDDPEPDEGRALWFARQVGALTELAQTLDLLGLDDARISEIRREGLGKLLEHLEPNGRKADVDRVRNWIKRDRVGTLDDLISLLWRSEWPVERMIPEEYRAGA